MEVQQSSLYLRYVRSLGWKIHKVDGVAILTKHFPLIGGLAKIQRPHKLPSLAKLALLLQGQRIKTVAPEPDTNVDAKQFQRWCQKLSHTFKINKSPYLPTKTIRIDLRPSEEKIFKRFTEAKRRGVRRAIKYGLVIKASTDIDDLIRIKNKSAGLFGFITTYGIKELWRIMAPERAAILLAYSSNNKLVGGILLLFINRLAYYWIAGATRKGKKLFAPTLLVWEALKLSKTRKCKEFDFVGIWDERLPGNFNAWKGFTKFKEGFGGNPVYYPIVQ